MTAPHESQLIPTNCKVELSDIEKYSIDKLLKHTPYPSGITIDALKIMQKHRGWISDGCIDALAQYTNIPHSDIDSVATFYNLIFRSPVGDTILHPCNGISCEIMGSKSIQQCISRTLHIQPGETTADHHITLIPLPCLGACDKAPVMLVNQHLYEQLDDQATVQILNELEGHKL